MNSSLRDILSTELAIIQAPMAGVQDSALAIAVSNAGGLGSLPCAMLSPDTLRTELAKLRAGTHKPFNLNFFCHTEPAPDAARERAWHELLAPYYDELGMDRDAIAGGASRKPFDADIADIVEPFSPAVVSFHFGLPSPALMARVKAWGSTVLSSATTVTEALWLEAHGADAIIAQGLEAGGHRGHFLSTDVTLQAGMFALLPQIARAVNIPVIAAGGIADRDGVAAAFALGAAGVQIGTSYLLCREATTSAVHRAALRSADATHTALTNLFSGGLARGIVNRLMRDLGAIHCAAPPFPLASAAIAPLRAAAERNGKGDFSPLWAGQNIAGCKEVGAAELTLELMS